MHQELTAAVITVGEGRGFIIEATYHYPRSIIITAAHCLPHLPPAAAVADSVERSYWNLLGPLTKQPSFAAECLFADPVSDLAVLGSVDNQRFTADAAAYEKFVSARICLTPVDTRLLEEKPVSAWLLTLDKRWVHCLVEPIDDVAWIREVSSEITGGMSGSPILLDGGAVIGVLCSGGGDVAGPNPILGACLPCKFHP